MFATDSETELVAFMLTINSWIDTELCWCCVQLRQIRSNLYILTLVKFSNIIIINFTVSNYNKTHKIDASLPPFVDVIELVGLIINPKALSLYHQPSPSVPSNV